MRSRMTSPRGRRRLPRHARRPAPSGHRALLRAGTAGASTSRHCGRLEVLTILINAQALSGRRRWPRGRCWSGPPSAGTSPLCRKEAGSPWSGPRPQDERCPQRLPTPADPPANNASGPWGLKACRRDAGWPTGLVLLDDGRASGQVAGYRLVAASDGCRTRTVICMRSVKPSFS
jgi:hypothetical protein